MAELTVVKLEGKEARTQSREMAAHIAKRKRAAYDSGAKTAEGFTMRDGKPVSIV